MVGKRRGIIGQPAKMSLNPWEDGHPGYQPRSRAEKKTTLYTLWSSASKRLSVLYHVTAGYSPNLLLSPALVKNRAGFWKLHSTKHANEAWCGDAPRRGFKSFSGAWQPKVSLGNVRRPRLDKQIDTSLDPHTNKTGLNIALCLSR